jgi:hypothetical protein
MGVDYYSCVKCGETFSDAGDYASCEGCGSMFGPCCMDECCDERDEETYEIHSCVVCRKELIPDAALVAFLLGFTGMTREEAERRYREDAPATPPRSEA